MLSSKNKKIFMVTGASGFVGQQVIKDLLPFANRIYAASRNPNKIKCSRKVKLVTINNLHELAAMKNLLSHVDVLIHIAAIKESRLHQLLHPKDYFNINFKQTLGLAINANECGVKRFIFLSSIKVNGEFSYPSKPFNLKSKVNPLTLYAKSKYFAEQELIKLSNKAQIDIVIIRSPAVYGFKSKGFLSVLEGLIKLKIPLPLLSFTNKRSFIYIENLTNAIVNCSFNPNAKNQILLVSDNYDIEMKDLIKMISKAINRRVFLFNFPPTFFKFFLNFIGLNFVYRRICCSLEVDIKSTIKTLGWIPPHSFKSSLRKAFKKSEDLN